MSRFLDVTDEQIAAARLRVILDRKLGRRTPELVARIATLPAPRAAEPDAPAKPVEQPLSVEEYRRVRDRILDSVGVGSTETEPADGSATDADLMAAHAAGDPSAFGELVRRHRDQMWAVALRTLRDPEEAADALQDAFISAFRAAANFRAESQVTTWLHRIVVNTCLDHIRHKQARPTVPSPETGFNEPTTPRDSMADRETRLVIQAALDQLPEDQRRPMVLIDIEGYSVAETARMLGIAEGTVKSRCARGRAKLAKILGQQRNPDADTDVPTHESERPAKAAVRSTEASPNTDSPSES